MDASRRRRDRNVERPWTRRGDAAALGREMSVDASRRRRGRDAVRPLMNRGDAAALGRGSSAGEAISARPRVRRPTFPRVDLEREGNIVVGDGEQRRVL